MVDLIHGSRLVAFLIIDGKVYESDIDHQECLQDWYKDTGQDSPFKWDNFDEEFESEHLEAMHTTHAMKESHSAYGFDLFEYDGHKWVLVAHDKKTLDDNLVWAGRYSRKNDAKIGYFTGDGWNIEVMQPAGQQKLETFHIKKEEK